MVFRYMQYGRFFFCCLLLGLFVSTSTHKYELDDFGIDEKETSTLHFSHTRQKWYELWKTRRLNIDTHNCLSKDTTGCGGWRMDSNDHRQTALDLVDYRRRIVMSWTAKAGCTIAVKMFLHDMGLREGIEYTGWVHHFREKYFYKLCGSRSECIYNSDAYYKFKVVRNPYDRAVSSYIHAMSTMALKGRFITATMPHISNKQGMSFKDFIRYLELSMPKPLEQNFNGFGHIHKQSYNFEFLHWLQTGQNPFNRIVKLENLETDIALVNQEASTSFFVNFSSHHYAKRMDKEQYHYVGDVPWHALKHDIPKDYGNFYDSDDEERIARIFYTDIWMYNYSFPFTRSHRAEL